MNTITRYSLLEFCAYAPLMEETFSIELVDGDTKFYCSPSNNEWELLLDFWFDKPVAVTILRMHTNIQYQCMLDLDDESFVVDDEFTSLLNDLRKRFENESDSIQQRFVHLAGDLDKGVFNAIH